MYLPLLDKVVTTMLALVLLIAGGAVASAQGGRGGHHGRHGGFGHLFRGITLSEAQQTQLREIAERHQQSTAPLREQLKANRGNEVDLLNGGTFDEATVRARAQARLATQVELEVAHARMMSEMYQVLTPEQRAELLARRQQWEQRRQQMRQQRNAQPGSTSSAPVSRA